MKKKIICLAAFITLFTTGCKKDSMDDITIYTTTYPIEYITNELYGENSNVYSIYPNEIIELSDKLIKDYSSANMFVYNGLSNEKNYTVKMLNNNKHLMPVDATMGMENENGIEELWLNPSNFLMLCLNIKNGMKEYIDNTVLRKQIDTNYEKLKLDISELDAEIKLLIENADDNHILVSNNAFKFLEKKYNDPNNSKEKKINVYSVANDDSLSDDIIAEIKKQINNKTISNIIMFPNDVLTDEVETLLKENNINKLYFDPLTTLSVDNKNLDKDYITVMKENLDVLKIELYKQDIE